MLNSPYKEGFGIYLYMSSNGKMLSVKQADKISIDTLPPLKNGSILQFSAKIQLKDLLCL